MAADGSRISSFELSTAARIVFGAGSVRMLPAWLAEQRAQHVLLVTGQSGARSTALSESAEALGIRVTRFAVASEPSVELVRLGSALCAESAVDAVLSFGGGSAIDAGKAIAALASNGGDPLDYLEVVGKGAPLTRAPLPFAAVPTTAGTGAEVTRNAVLSVKQHGVKASLRSPLMLPRLAVIDPDLLREAPSHVLRASGLDALSQLIEPFVSCKHNPISDALAQKGIEHSRRSLRTAVLHTAGESERDDLALASLLGGLCLANSGLGAVHGFAAPAGGMFEAPHGAVCAALLPHVLAVNLRALQTRAPDGAMLARYTQLAGLLTGHSTARAEDGVVFLSELCDALSVPGLSAYGMREADLSVLVDKAEKASSMRGNSLVLTRDELLEIASLSL